MKNQKGITLIALIITIIVMLILVGVSVSVALNTGLFKTAQGAGKNTQLASEEELQRSNGFIKLEGVTTDVSIQGYVDSLAGGNGGAGNVEITFSKISAGDLAIGSEVRASNGETFYVIGVSADNTEVNLLAKYNLKADGSAQDITGASNPCVFCSKNAWNAANVEDYDDLNAKQTIQLDTTSAVYKAMAYGAALGGTGRIPKKGEVDILGSQILFGQYETGSYLNYWLGSTYYDDNVWTVCGQISNADNTYCPYNIGSEDGVRPVITILKSSIN